MRFTTINLSLLFCSSAAGTRHDQFAKFRACPCLKGFHRLDRFGSCLQCPSVGLTCTNETVELNPGYYWKWTSEEVRRLYENFTKGLQVQSDKYDRRFTRFLTSLPKAYACPVAGSCLGGMTSSCSEGYEGVLCAVCSEGYHKVISSCQKCPTLGWMVAGIVLAVLLLFLIMVPLIFGKKMRDKSGRSVTDVVLARLKIVIGFYQVMSGILEAFSYVQWPAPLLQLGTYAKFLQLNLLQIASINCFISNAKVNSYTSLLLSLAVIIAAVIISFTFFYMRRMYLCKRNFIHVDERENLISGTKEVSFRYAFLFLFILYPAMCAQIFQILPPSCQKICTGDQEKTCQSFLRSDYRLQCFTDTHNKFSILAFSLLSFVVGFPLLVFFLLWKYHYRKCNQGKQNEIEAGLSFLYENYSENCWFWEVLELVRKIILTSVLVLIGDESRTNLGVAAITSGLYTLFFASYQPVSDRFEHWLHLVSLMATCANMNVGMLLKIPADNISSGVNTDAESIVISILLVSVNLLVIGMVAGG